MSRLEFAPMRQQIEAEQAFVVLKDVADIMLALIRFDDRHRRLPGWHGLVGVNGSRSDRPLRAASGTTHSRRSAAS